MARQRKKEKKRFLLVDADIPVYRFSCVNETHIEWEGEVSSHLHDLDKAKLELTAFVEHLAERTNSTNVIMCLSSDYNFRYTVYPDYKSNRKNKEDPVLRDALKQYVTESFDSRIVLGLEADDVLGILATMEINKEADYVMASIDKDLKQIPGVLYNWDKGAYTTSTKQQGMFWHYYQTLCGDPVDGYSGCPGIGKKKAERFLFEFFDQETLELKQGKEEVELWEGVVNLYALKGLSEGDAITQARVAKILTAKDFDFKKGKPILWSPPNGPL